MILSKSKEFTAQNGTSQIIFQNTSNSEHDVELQITIIDSTKKSFIDKLKELFTNDANNATISFGRKTSKALSTFLHTELVTADKAYKESTKEKIEEVPITPAPKPETPKTRKPRKKPTNGENSGVSSKA